jgi:hypothetical protein
VRRVPIKIPTPLPGAHHAWIPLDPLNKIKDFALNVEHHQGGSKAKWFRDRLGIVRDDWEFLHDQILDRLPDCYIADMATRTSRPAEGVQFGVEIPIDGRDGRSAPIHTGWLVPLGLFPRPKLLTTRPARRRTRC